MPMIQNPDYEIVRAQLDVSRAATALYIFKQDRRNAILSFCEESSPEHAWQPPILWLDKGQCQQLMDDLWAAGTRPTEGSGSAGSLAATERHLSDMRHLVFKGQAPPFGR